MSTSNSEHDNHHSHNKKLTCLPREINLYFDTEYEIFNDHITFYSCHHIAEKNKIGTRYTKHRYCPDSRLDEDGRYHSYLRYVVIPENIYKMKIKRITDENDRKKIITVGNHVITIFH